jgi:hypothetical protein
MHSMNNILTLWMRLSSRVNQLTKSNRIIYDAKGCSDVVISLSQTVPLTNPKFSIYWGGNHDNTLSSIFPVPHIMVNVLQRVQNILYFKQFSTEMG